MVIMFNAGLMKGPAAFDIDAIDCDLFGDNLVSADFDEFEPYTTCSISQPGSTGGGGRINRRWDDQTPAFVAGELQPQPEKVAQSAFVRSIDETVLQVVSRHTEAVAVGEKQRRINFSGWNQGLAQKSPDIIYAVARLYNFGEDKGTAFRVLREITPVALDGIIQTHPAEAFAILEFFHRNGTPDVRQWTELATIRLLQERYGQDRERLSLAARGVDTFGRLAFKAGRVDIHILAERVGVHPEAFGFLVACAVISNNPDAITALKRFAVGTHSLSSRAREIVHRFF